MEKERFFITFLTLSIFVFIFSLFFYQYKPQSMISTQNDDPGPIGCQQESLDGNVDYSQKAAIFEGNSINIPRIAYDISPTNVLGVSSEERWVEVDLSEQKLIAWEGDQVFLETPISSGLSYYPTPTGTFRIWSKLRATKMEGGSGAYYYYLPNVPYVMFFENEEVAGGRGYGLHGTYWHSDFGTPRSHGCVNLPTEIAKDLYYWTGPVVPEGKWMARSDIENQGTRIVIHE